jgi:DNA-nicking Smr family endonuclease
MSDSDEIEPRDFELPIDGVLDLHTFSPHEISELVEDYLRECRRRRIYAVRIIHGKGIGVQRERVHAVLRRLQPELVQTFRLADETAGGWGATVVDLQSGE